MRAIPFSRVVRSIFALVCSTVAISALLIAVAPILSYFIAGDEYAFQDLSINLSVTLTFIMLSSLLLLVMAILPSLAIAYVAEKQNRQEKAWFMLTGIGISSVWLFAGYLFGFGGLLSEVIYGDMAFQGTREMAISIAALAVICGALGGWVYWAIAGRHSGDWKSHP